MAAVDATAPTTLERAKSAVPCSSTNTESCVVNAKLDVVWAKIKEWKLDELAPSIVTSIDWLDGAAGKVDSTVKITYRDGAFWCWRVTELSERNNTIAYELISTEPAISVSSIVGEISLSAVTDDDSTFVSWSTEHSNDVDSEFMGDTKWKKREMFAAYKQTFGAEAAAEDTAPPAISAEKEAQIAAFLRDGEQRRPEVLAYLGAIGREGDVTVPSPNHGGPRSSHSRHGTATSTYRLRHCDEALAQGPHTKDETYITRFIHPSTAPTQDLFLRHLKQSEARRDRDSSNPGPFHQSITNKQTNKQTSKQTGGNADICVEVLTLNNVPVDGKVYDQTMTIGQLKAFILGSYELEDLGGGSSVVIANTAGETLDDDGITLQDAVGRRGNLRAVMYA